MFVKLFSVGLILRRAAQQGAQEVPGNAQAGVIHVHKMQQHGGVFMVQCQADAVYQRADQRGGVQYKQVFAGGVAGARLLGCPRTEAAFLLVKQVVDDSEPQFGQIPTECGAGVVDDIITSNAAAAASLGKNTAGGSADELLSVPVGKMLFDPLQVKHSGGTITNRHQVTRCETKNAGIAVTFGNGGFKSAKNVLLLPIDKEGERVAIGAEIVRGDTAVQIGALFIADDAADLRMTGEKFDAPLQLTRID